MEPVSTTMPVVAVSTSILASIKLTYASLVATYGIFGANFIIGFGLAVSIGLVYYMFKGIKFLYLKYKDSPKVILNHT